MSKPGSLINKKDVERVKDLIITVFDNLEMNYIENIFTNDGTITTSQGIELTSIDDALILNSFQEGLHKDDITALKCLLK